MASKRRDKGIGSTNDIEIRLRNYLRSMEPPEELSDKVFLENLMKNLDAVERSREDAMQSAPAKIPKNASVSASVNERQGGANAGHKRRIETGRRRSSGISPLKRVDRWLCSLPTSLVGIAASILIIITLHTAFAYTLSKGAKASMHLGTELTLFSLNQVEAVQKAAHRATYIGLFILEIFS